VSSTWGNRRCLLGWAPTEVTQKISTNFRRQRQMKAQNCPKAAALTPSYFGGNEKCRPWCGPISTCVPPLACLFPFGARYSPLATTTTELLRSLSHLPTQFRTTYSFLASKRRCIASLCFQSPDFRHHSAMLNPLRLRHT